MFEKDYLTNKQETRFLFFDLYHVDNVLSNDCGIFQSFEHFIYM